MQFQDGAGVYSMWGFCGGEGGEKVDLIQIQDNYMVAARNVKRLIWRNLRKNSGL